MRLVGIKTNRLVGSKKKLEDSIREIEIEHGSLKPFLDNRLHVRIAEVIYRNVFERFSKFLDNRSAKWTRKFCEDNTPNE